MTLQRLYLLRLRSNPRRLRRWLFPFDKKGQSPHRDALWNRTGTDRERSRLWRIRGCARDRQTLQHNLQLLMEANNISRILAQDPLMCHYEVVAKYTLPEVVSTYPSNTHVCNTHDSDQPGEHWVAMYVEEIGDYFDQYGQKPQHAEFTNFMNAHCSQWSPNDRMLQSPISTVCGQYCVAFLMFRCRNIPMHAFARLFISDLIANDCRVFDWLGALNKKG